MNADRALILIVDDTTDNIDLLRETLRGSYRIKAATNGEKALAWNLNRHCVGTCIRTRSTSA